MIDSAAVGTVMAVAADGDLVFQIRTHLLFEVRWLTFAATEFVDGDRHWVPLFDSACMHARNLFEFMEQPDGGGRFSLAALGGERRRHPDWAKFLNSRVMHMYHREHHRPGWPDRIGVHQPDRVLRLADVVVSALEDGGRTVRAGPVRDAYEAVVVHGRFCLESPSDEAQARWDVLYDGSRDDRPYAGG